MFVIQALELREKTKTTEPGYEEKFLTYWETDNSNTLSDGLN